MGTERIFHSDPYCTAFEAAIVERTEHEGRPAVVLDRTAFYPASGGQPCDTGTLDSVGVVDVIEREPDGAIVHVLASELPADRVAGRRVSANVAWDRRFDHMQHHTGQHILSRAFEVVAGAETVGFHLGVESVTVDLNRTDLDASAFDAVEDLANRIVVGNLPVRAWHPTPAELAELSLRTRAPLHGDVRVVQVGDFDANACCGTHVERTGEIGIIKILKGERRGAETRIEFRCGGRALRDYRRKNAAIHAAAGRLGVGAEELDQAVQRIQAEAKASRADLKKCKAELLAHEARELAAGAGLASVPAAAPSGGVRLLKRVFENREQGDLNALAAGIVAKPGFVALLGSAGAKAQLVFARSPDLECDMVKALAPALGVLGVTRGGGRPAYASGGGVGATVTQVEAALAAGERAVLDLLAAGG